jgi:hypothetical protein
VSVWLARVSGCEPSQTQGAWRVPNPVPVIVSTGCVAEPETTTFKILGLPPSSAIKLKAAIAQIATKENAGFRLRRFSEWSGKSFIGISNAVRDSTN